MVTRRVHHDKAFADARTQQGGGSVEENPTATHTRPGPLRFTGTFAPDTGDFRRLQAADQMRQ